MNPQKNSFGFFFQNKFQPSTTVVRVVSLSHWTKTSPEKYRLDLIGDH
jgi:hypothetical protein